MFLRKQKAGKVSKCDFKNQGDNNKINFGVEVQKSADKMC